MEGYERILTDLRCTLYGDTDRFVEFIHSRIRVVPAIGKGFLIECPKIRLNRRLGQQRRTGWNKQPNRVLYRIDVID